MHRRDAYASLSSLPTTNLYTRDDKTARQQLDHSRWEEWGDVRRLSLRGVAGPEPARETTPLYMNHARAKLHVEF